MSIYRVSENLTISEKIRLLNEMIIEVNGKVLSGQFNENEITAIYAEIGSGYTRKYRRNIGIGNSLSTYANWSHVHAESGYSIWKIAPTRYAYNTNNQLYMDGRALTNKGEANSETATSFSKVYLYDGATTTYIDNTTEAGTEDGTEFSLMDATNDYLYIGGDTTFGGAKFEFQTRGSNYTLLLEYWNGSDWDDLVTSGDVLADNTNNFEGDGSITWTIPTDWIANSVNSQSKYWIRISTTATPVTTAKAYLIIPNNSVIGLLALSASEISDETWKWCTYGSSIYVTIRNSGNSNYEGDYYITSASTTSNLQNFFIYNNPFTADYQDSYWS